MGFVVPALPHWVVEDRRQDHPAAASAESASTALIPHPGQLGKMDASNYSDRTQKMCEKAYKEISNNSAPTTLICLPAEIRLKIGEFVSTNHMPLGDVTDLLQLPRTSDLNNVCRASKTLNALFGPLLYRSVHLFVTQDRFLYIDIDFSVSAFTQYTEGLQVSSWWCEDGGYDNYDDDGDHEHDLPNVPSDPLYGTSGIPADMSRIRDLTLGLNRIVSLRISLMAMEKLRSLWYVMHFVHFDLANSLQLVPPLPNHSEDPQGHLCKICIESQTTEAKSC